MRDVTKNDMTFMQSQYIAFAKRQGSMLSVELNSIYIYGILMM